VAIPLPTTAYGTNGVICELSVLVTDSVQDQPVNEHDACKQKAAAAENVDTDNGDGGWVVLKTDTRSVAPMINCFIVRHGCCQLLNYSAGIQYITVTCKRLSPLAYTRVHAWIGNIATIRSI